MILIAFAAVSASLAVDEPDSFDPGKAVGSEIQTYRDHAIPREYPAPARAWVYADVAVMAGLLITGMWLVRTNRSSRWISIQLAFALLYFGFARGGCICPVGATANVFLGIQHPELVGLATLALFLLPLVAALACGRVFCGSVCPLGALQHLLSSPKAKPLPLSLHRALLFIPPAILVATTVRVWLGCGFLPCEIDPYVPAFFQSHSLLQKLASLASSQYAEPVLILAGSSKTWALLSATLIAGWFVPRIFCRYLCPYGVLLGLFSAVAFWRRQINAESCLQCNRCVKHCPVQAIENARDGSVSVSPFQCVQCGRCHELCAHKSIATRGQLLKLNVDSDGP
ncbi:MAG: 4Fe-4S binding protein [Verrucomicrobiota bacterium]